jgi:hypothetical protein
MVSVNESSIGRREKKPLSSTSSCGETLGLWLKIAFIIRSFALQDWEWSDFELFGNSKLVLRA